MVLLADVLGGIVCVPVGTAGAEAAGGIEDLGGGKVRVRVRDGLDGKEDEDVDDLIEEADRDGPRWEATIADRSERLIKRLNSYLSGSGQYQLGVSSRKGSRTANELLYITIPLDFYHICRWRVANLVWVIYPVGFDVPHLSHVLREDQYFMSKLATSDEICAPQLAPSSRHPSSGFSWRFRVCVSRYASLVADTYTFVMWVPIFR